MCVPHTKASCSVSSGTHGLTNCEYVREKERQFLFNFANFVGRGERN
jgi:hypothetical protein